MEAGITVSISKNQVSTFEHLKKYFIVKFVVESNNAKVAKVKISHTDPTIEIGNNKRPLLFSEGVFDYCRKMWDKERKIDYLFIGLITPERKDILTRFQKRVGSIHLRDKIVITDSEKGRQFPEKAWDDEYYQMMSRAKFVLCPNGDFVWTYRFFEAILCGAIPIIQDYCELYEGFTYYTMDSPSFEYTHDIAENNLLIAKKLLTIPKDEIKKSL